jgi:hypothetical protein
MIQAIRGSGVKGSWNESHSVWTTADGRYKIVRRFPSKGAKAAWIARATHSLDGQETTRFSFARKIIADQIKRDAGIDVPTKNVTNSEGAS